MSPRERYNFSPMMLQPWKPRSHPFFALVLSAACAGLSLSAGARQAAPAASPAAGFGVGPVQRLLVLDPVGERGRSPAYTDALELELLRGTFQEPSAGASVTRADGSQATWREVESADGKYSDAALRGGWAFARARADQPGVLLLEAAGHAFVYAGGVPRGGDVYSLGFVRTPIAVGPQGTPLLFKAGRGTLNVALSRPPAPVFIEDRDATLPDLVAGVKDRFFAGVTVVNATDQVQRELMLSAGVELSGKPTFLGMLRIPQLLPLEIRKVALPLPLLFDPPAGAKTVPLVLSLAQTDPAGKEAQINLHQQRFDLAVRGPNDVFKVTFQSQIDGSAQYFAVRPALIPAEGTPQRVASLVLSLHGAGVEATAHAASYEAKPWCHVVAPTNRRPFGFDWEDWGRKDALEVLRAAVRRLGTDLDRTYLTGHSMGGHGSFSMGVWFPSLFAAIAPSAGWIDFWTYGSGWKADPSSPVEALLERSANVYRPMLAVENLRRRGVYLLHGTADDNVPVTETRAIQEAVAALGGALEVHEEPGAGHWWGNACVDYPPLFSFLQKFAVPPDPEPLELSFTTVDPGQSSRLHWLVLEAQQRPLQASTIHAQLQPEANRLRIVTRNVARMLLEVGKLSQPASSHAGTLQVGKDFFLQIDGQTLEVNLPDSNAIMRLRRSRSDGSWNAMTEVPPNTKGPLRNGLFKSAFDNQVVFVYGTQGTPEENDWSLAKARLDAESWRYRANGSVSLIADTEFSAKSNPEQNVVLYGHSQMVSCYGQLVNSRAFDLQRGKLKISDRTLERDDLALLAVYPRAESQNALVGIVGGTGMPGLRLTNHLPYFVSGIGYPDWTVFGSEMLTSGAKGILGAGFFGENWSVDTGEYAWTTPATPR